MKNDNKEIKQGGMGYFAKQLMVNELKENENTIMIDPQEEYKKITEMLSLKNEDINSLESEGFYHGISKVKEGCKFETYEIAKNERHFILGTPGVGRAYYPWDNLKLCECGGSPWMEGKNGGNFEEGEPYRIRCCKCGKHTPNGDVQEVKNEWNNM